MPLIGADVNLQTSRIDRAARAARAAAARAGVTVRPLEDVDEVVRLNDVFAAVWGLRGGGAAFVPVELAQALRFSGNYIVGAFDGDRMVGGSVAFLGEHDDCRHLHSHITGVLPDLQHRSVGYALKLYQRGWALAHGIDEVVWTFDPLIRRNAYFNLAKLRARIVDYHERFYGDALDDDINRADESDRAVLVWPVGAAEVAEAVDGTLRRPSPTGGTVLLDIGDGDEPAVADVDPAGVVRARVPADIVALRRTRPDLALAWRFALREVMERAIERGYVAVDMSRDGWYTLLPPERGPVPG
ncbi:MAG: GNAT family N-acetyltransferase [Acidimicrobiales bacterium]